MPQPHSLPTWAQEASLGIFVHWGAYSVPAWAEPTGALGTVPDEEWFAHNAYAEWYANTIRIAGSPAAAHHADVHGGRPYISFLETWRAEKYDPVDWVHLFQAAGADYVVPVTKHHDGICLWDAPGESVPTTTSAGPGRDLLDPLARATRAAGLHFGVYYSGGLDWTFANYPPITSSGDLERLRPNGADYAAYATAQVDDLIERYRPALIWNDINWPDAAKEDGSLEALLTRYRRAVPDGIVNDRWGAPVWDYRTSEYAHDVANESGSSWEHTRGLGFSFGYNQVEDAALTMSPRELAQLYADVVSRGGRLLLNVGPEASGQIPDVQRRTLAGVAEFMTAVKPLTGTRRTLAAEDVTVRGTDWWRAWRSGDQVVVVADRDDVDTRARDGRPVTVVPLPSV
ncbi:alpha-L-fucosidase [Ruania albidiflava]|uniref:alpha-L-fucosidase n=1 Tax=Ruania albidiflava TaxID=366586 RepID=UPI0023F38418|nr:alpha-L-fucosidase [Ruania albidiflava]